jgi:shikimate kinase
MNKSDKCGKRNITLFGFMGTGKTSAGRLLAGRLGLDFVDMDVVIEKRAGKPISRIFAEEGEPYFRNMERELVKDLSAGSGMVIAAGGGVVLNSQNVADYARTGLAVCLSAAPQTILKRLEGDTTRPLLADGDKALKVAGLLEKRKAFYGSVPVQIDTNGLSIEQVVDKIAAEYGKA